MLLNPFARRATLVALTLLAALPMSAAPSSARETVRAGVDLVGRPQVAGPDVYYQERGSGDDVVLRRARPGVAPTDVMTAKVGSTCQADGEFADCDSTSFAFDVSAARLAFSTSAVFEIADKPDQVKISTGPLAGPFSTLISCDKTGSENFYGYRVDGDAIAYDTNECSDGLPGRRIVVRSFAPGAPAPRTFASDSDTSFAF